MAETPLTPDQVVEAEARAEHEGYLHRLLVGLDQFVNVAFGGKLDETISAHSQQLAQEGNPFGKFMSWWLAKIQPDHGELAEAGDLARATAQMELEQRLLNVGLSAYCGCSSDESPENFTAMEVSGEENGPAGIFVILRCTGCQRAVKVKA
jgi:hypothetical protein